MHDAEATVYKKYDDDDYIVRKMLSSDVDTVLDWWSQSTIPPKDDLHIAVDIFKDENAFFIGEYEGKPVACLVHIPWGCNVIYGSLYFCVAQYRRRHFASRLRDDVASRFLNNAVLVVDAVKGFVSDSNVNKFGYVAISPTNLFRGQAQVVSSQYTGRITEICNHNFGEIIDFDNKHFVSAKNPGRRLYLERLFNLPTGRTIVATEQSGEITGLACRRPGTKQGSHTVGPIYAINQNVATALLSSLCSDIVGDIITIVIWNRNDQAVALMKNFGLPLVTEMVQQCFNGTVDVYKPTVYAVTTAALCGF